MNAAVETKEKETQENTKTRLVTGAQGVLLSLLEEGVDTIFGYPLRRPEGWTRYAGDVEAHFFNYGSRFR